MRLTHLPRIRVSLSLIAVLVALSLSGCASRSSPNNPQPSDPLLQIAKQTNAAAKALDNAVDLKRTLFKGGLITKEQSNALTVKLLAAVRLAREINEGAQTYSSYAEGKASLSALFRQLQGSFNDLADSFLPQLNETARSRINAALTLAITALSVLNPLLGGG